MKVIYIGGDVSKGYVDVAFLNQSMTFLQEAGRFDDTAIGQSQLRDRILKLKEKHDPVQFVVGLEASGGLERNWLKFFREMKTLCDIKVFLLNPLAVRKFFERNLRRNKTDRISARNIAEYLFSGGRRKENRTNCWEWRNDSFRRRRDPSAESNAETSCSRRL